MADDGISGFLAWRLRHLFAVRRCPRCRVTWEERRVMDRYQGGVCHDCFGDTVVHGSVAYESIDAPLCDCKGVVGDVGRCDGACSLAMTQIRSPALGSTVPQARSGTVRHTGVRVHYEDGHYWAEVVDLPGVFASGETLDELVKALGEAFSLVPWFPVCFEAANGVESVHGADQEAQA